MSDLRPGRVAVAAGCGASRRRTPSAAWMLYTGSYAAACIGWARSVAPLDGGVFVLSAWHGLIPAVKVVAPYKVAMGQFGSVDGGDVAVQLRALGLSGRCVVMAGGARFVDVMRDAGACVTAPFAGVGGLGDQIAAMKAAHGTVPGEGGCGHG